MNGIVYHVFNKLNGKAYVGQTIGSFEKRKARHLRIHQKGNNCKYLTAALRKYGPDSFVWSILTLINTNQDDLNLAEDYWISYFQTLAPNGYNLKRSGSKGKHSEQALMNMRIAQNMPHVKFAKQNAVIGKRSNPRTEEQKQRMKEAQNRPEVKLKRSLALRGRKHGPRTPEQIQHYRESNKRNANRPEAKERTRQSNFRRWKKWREERGRE